MREPPDPIAFRALPAVPAARDDDLSALDLHRRLVAHPAATFFMRAAAAAPTPGIRPGDILVVDRALDPHPGDTVVVPLAGALRLVAARQVPPDTAIWGVVRALARELRR